MGIVHVIQKFCSHKDKVLQHEFSGLVIVKCRRCDKNLSHDVRIVEHSFKTKNFLVECKHENTEPYNCAIGLGYICTNCGKGFKKIPKPPITKE